MRDRRGRVGVLCAERHCLVPENRCRADRDRCADAPVLLHGASSACLFYLCQPDVAMSWEKQKCRVFGFLPARRLFYSAFALAFPVVGIDRYGMYAGGGGFPDVLYLDSVSDRVLSKSIVYF